MPKTTLSQDKLLQAMQAPAVRTGLAQAARIIAAEYDAEARRDDYYDDGPTSGGRKLLEPARPIVTDGTRPKGRPYSRVAVPAEDELGDYKQPKRRILGRLAAKYNTPRG